MAFTSLSASTAIIAALADLPNATSGLTAAQLKAKFDEAATSIKTYINSTLLAELAAITDGDSGADNIAATAITGLNGATVQALLESLKNKFDTLNPISGFVSVKDPTYGAAGDGVTDDTAAINAAITATPVGGTLYFPIGNYLVSGSGAQIFNITKDINIHGAGFYSRIRPAASVPVTTNIIRYSPSAGSEMATFKDFFIYPISGTPGKNAIFIEITAASGQSISRMKIENVKVAQLGGKAVYISNGVATDGVFCSTIIDCSLAGGIALDGAGDSVIIERNTISGAGIGIFSNLVGGASCLSARDNNITSTGGGFYIKGGTETTLENNNIEQTVAITADATLGLTAGAMIHLIGQTTDRLKKCRVIKNHLGAFTGSGAKCVLLEYTDKCRVEDNKIITDTADGIEITTNGRNNIIQLNDITGSGNPISNSGEGTIGVLMALTLQNSWVDFNTTFYTTPGYIKDEDGWVTFKGYIKNGTITTGTVIATLPTGFIPAKIVPFMFIHNSSGVYTAGEVRMAGASINELTIQSLAGSTGIPLEGLRFYVG